MAGGTDGGAWIEPLEARLLLGGFEGLDLAPPRVVSTVADSSRGDLTIQFSEPVVASLADVVVEDAVGQAVSLASATLEPSPGGDQVLLAFHGALADGRYALVLRGAGIHDLAGNPLDGNGDGQPGDDYAHSFFRLFGDADGDRDVDFADLLRFRRTYQKSAGDPAFDARFDADADGVVGAADLAAFGNNYQKALVTQTYYVRPDGDDSADGLTDATAWRTVAHVNAFALVPGDSVLFKRDGTWRETLRPPSSGTPDSPITFGAYGSGQDPIITGSDQIDAYLYHVTGTPENAEDFETGGDAAWWSGSSHLGDSLVVASYVSLGISGPAGGGAYGGRFNPNMTGHDSYLEADFAADQVTLWAECDWRTNAADRDQSVVFTVSDTTGSLLFSLRFIGTTTKTLQIHNWVASTDVTIETGLAPNTWYHLRLQVAVDPGSGNAFIRVQRDGRPWVGPAWQNWPGRQVGRLYWGTPVPDQASGVSYGDNLKYAFGEWDNAAGLGDWTVTYPDIVSTEDGTPMVFVGNIQCAQADSLASLQAGQSTPQFYRDDATQTLWLADDPTDHAVEVPVRPAALQLNGTTWSRSYLVFDALAFTKARGSTVAAYAPFTGEAATGDTFLNCLFDGAGYAGLAIGMHVNSLVVEDCEFTRDQHAGAFMNNADAAGHIPTDILFQGNRIHDVYRQGIALERCRNVTITDNLIYNVFDDSEPLGRGIDVQGINPGVQGRIEITWNTVYNCDEFDVVIVEGDPDLQSVEVAYNILFATGNARAFRFLIPASGPARPLYNDYNAMWHTSPSGTVASQGPWSYSRTQLPAYQATGYMTHGLFADPLLGLDFKPLPGSPCPDWGWGHDE